MCALSECYSYTDDERGWLRICPNNVYYSETVCHILTQAAIIQTNG